ncbi:hypothetical protein [Georgenia alba]|uniref:Transposase n=1 Tax=Georgenia alba TaxID=2233858 RepID=A0ABW2QC84_9MICO
MPSPSPDLLSVANELYGLPLGDFVPTRNTRAKQARKDGDTDLAWAIQGLAKPSTAAWLVNLMVRHMSEEIGQVLELGETLRRAQGDLDAKQLRALGQQRRKLLAAVVDKGRDLAAEQDQKVSGSVAEQAADTLQAAMADETAAAALRTGLLVQPMSATGLGSVDLEGVVAVPDALGEAAPRASGRKASPRRARAGKDEEAERKAATERARSAVEEAERAARKAGREVKSQEEKVSRLEARALQLRSEIDELRRRLVDREHALMDAEDRLEMAEDARDSATAAAEEAEDALEDARRTLRGLQGRS